MTQARHILLIEDDEDIRRVTCATLRSAGYDVAEAENGRQGLALIGVARPDLIILDVMMPEMNGAEFCRALVEDLKLPELPVLILSSINEKSGLMRSLADVDLRRREFLKKPVGPVELKLRVAQMLGLEPRPDGKAGAETAGTAPARATPASRGSEAAGSRDGSPVPGGPRLRVLLVDDDRDLLQINKFALQREFEVATAENGLDGLEMLDLFEPDFVVVDYNMPGMDGLEMVELMRRHPHFHQTPALFLTGNEERQLPRRAHEAGINLFLRKPIEAPRLRHALGQFVKEAGLRPREAVGPAAAPVEAPPPSRAKLAPAAPAAPADGPGGEGGKARLRPRGSAEAAPAGKAGAPPRGGSSAGGGRVRIFIVDTNEATAGRLAQLAQSALAQRAHVQHVADHRDALAQLARWEPDIILCNPRNQGLDGIGFFQLFKLKRLDLDVEFAFAGKEFVGAEQKYSRQSFGREVLDLKATDSQIVYELQAMVEKAERKARPKRHTIEELAAEDAKEQQQQQKLAEREARQREFDRQRFGRIQQMLDRES